MNLELENDEERDVLRRCLLAGDEKLRRQIDKVPHSPMCHQDREPCSCGAGNDFDHFDAATKRATIETLIRRLDGLHG